MGLESPVVWIEDLDETWPLNTDGMVNQDDHTRNIKTSLKNCFPGASGNGFAKAITATEDELNIMDGGTIDSSVALVATDQLIVNDAGVMKQTALSDLDAYRRAVVETMTGKTLTSPVLDGSLSGSAFLDDDSFATANATSVASSESIKAYVDGAVGPVNAATKDLLFTRSAATSGRVQVNNTQLGTAGAKFALIEIQMFHECVSANLSHQRSIRTRIFNNAVTGIAHEVAYESMLFAHIGNIHRVRTQHLVPLDANSDFWYQVEIFNTGSGGGSSFSVEGYLVGYFN